MPKLNLAGATKHRVLVTRPVSAAALARLGQFFEVECCTPDSVATLDGFIAQLQHKAAAVIGHENTMDASVIARLSNLKAVCNLSAEFDNLDLKALTKAGIHAMNTPTGSDSANAQVAENLIAAFGFGRLGGRPPNLLNPELLCDCC